MSSFAVNNASIPKNPWLNLELGKTPLSGPQYGAEALPNLLAGNGSYNSEHNGTNEDSAAMLAMWKMNMC